MRWIVAPHERTRACYQAAVHDSRVYIGTLTVLSLLDPPELLGPLPLWPSMLSAAFACEERRGLPTTREIQDKQLKLEKKQLTEHLHPVLNAKLSDLLSRSISAIAPRGAAATQ